MLRRTFSAFIVASLVAVVGVVGAPAVSARGMDAGAMLNSLWVEPENTSMYNRDGLGPWRDADRDGCDTAAEVFIAESSVPTGGGCPVRTGKWVSWIDGATWTDTANVRIGYLVPMSQAWASGAYAWTTEQRVALANDLDWGPTLTVMSANGSASSGGLDPALWLPPSSGATCRYIGEWLTVKYRWNLSVDEAEYVAIASLLSGWCAGLTVDVPPKAGTPEPVGLVRAYVGKVYRDLFRRKPDSAGLATWTNALRSGTPYGEVANGITYSPEYRTRMIRDAYRTYLDREPDAAGLASWLREMQGGMHIEQMQSGFIASPEYYARGGGTDSGWITRLYVKVLGRTPAGSEIAFWKGRLNSGASREAVARGFLYSTEHLTTVVNGYYRLLLRRNIDASGRRSWVSAIQAGARDEQIIALIVSSEEYRSYL